MIALIIRGLNEDIIPQLIDLGRRHPRVVRYLHFRNAAKLGRYQETEPYQMSGLKALVSSYFSPEEFRPRSIGEVNCPPQGNPGCCYRFRPTPRLQISLIEFGSPRSFNCPRRGRITNGGRTVRQMFESMRIKL